MQIQMRASAASHGNTCANPLQCTAGDFNTYQHCRHILLTYPEHQIPHAYIEMTYWVVMEVCVLRNPQDMLPSIPRGRS